MTYKKPMTKIDYDEERLAIQSNISDLKVEQQEMIEYIKTLKETLNQLKTQLSRHLDRKRVITTALNNNKSKLRINKKKITKNLKLHKKIDTLYISESNTTFDLNKFEKQIGVLHHYYGEEKYQSPQELTKELYDDLKLILEGLLNELKDQKEEELEKQKVILKKLLDIKEEIEKIQLAIDLNYSKLGSAKEELEKINSKLRKNSNADQKAKKLYLSNVKKR